MEAKHVKDLMEAYASVYVQSEEVVSEETLEEKKIATETGKKVMPSAEERSKLAKRARAGEDIGKKGKGFEAVAAKAAKQYGSKEAGERVAAAAMFKAQAKEEVETDLFDYILEHLVAEGYADTNKAALAIMANMSEEWKQSIVEANLNLNAPGGRSGWGRTTSGTAQGDFEAGGGLTKMQKSGMSRDDVIIQGQKNIRNSPLGRSNTGRGVYAKDRSTEVGRKQNDIYGKAGVKFPEDSK
jgi:hypothetical protein